MFLFKRQQNLNKGFTLIELMVVITISGILFGLVGINLFKLQNNTTKNNVVGALVSDLKLQQTKAINGASEGRTTSDNYGIHFLSDRYVLFHGSAYAASESANFTVELPENVEILNTTLPNNTIIFTKISGEFSGFTDGNNTITIQESNNSTDTTITINRYGVITSVE